MLWYRIKKFCSIILFAQLNVACIVSIVVTVYAVHWHYETVTRSLKACKLLIRPLYVLGFVTLQGTL